MTSAKEANSVKDYLQQPYARIVIPVESNCFHAEILEFTGCVAQGETVAKAYANLENAAESWIESCLAQGQNVPEPSSNISFSGRTVVRFPRGIHRKAAMMAERDQTSLNTYIVSAVSSQVGAEDFYTVLARRFERHISELMGALVSEWSVATSGTFDKKLTEVKPDQVTSTATGGPIRIAEAVRR